MTAFESSALRLMTTGETEYDAPVVENTYEQLRENWEALMMLTHNTTMYGTLTGVSSSGWVKAAAGSISNNTTQMTGMTLAILSGSAISNMYNILGSSGNTRVKASDPFTDGASTDDTFKIFHTIKRNSSQHGHDHDGTNSPEVVLADDAVTQEKIADDVIDRQRLVMGTAKSTGSVGADQHVGFAMSGYSFFPKLVGANSTRIGVALQQGSTTLAYDPYIGLVDFVGGGSVYAVLWRYVTASNNPFQYILRDPITKEIKARWQGDDPPGYMHTCTTKPADFTPPIKVGEGNENYEEIICFNYDREHWLNLMRSNTSLSKSNVIKDMYYDKKSKRFKPNKK